MGVEFRTPPLAASATWYEGGASTFWNYRIQEKPADLIRVLVYADKAGTLYLDESDDEGITSSVLKSIAVSAKVAAVLPWTVLTKGWYRLRYVNGATAQGSFRIVKETRPLEISGYYKELYKTPDYIIPLFSTLAWSGFTSQPDGDAVEILSDSASDTGKLTIFGTKKTGGALTYETVTLTGTDAVTTTEDDWGNIYGAFLGDIYGRNIVAAVGTITLREASGDQAITTLTAGDISTGMVGFDLKGKDISVIHVSGNLYLNQGADVTVDNGYPFASGEKLLIRPDGIIYLISDGGGATSKIIVYKE